MQCAPQALAEMYFYTFVYDGYEKLLVALRLVFTKHEMTMKKLMIMLAGVLFAWLCTGCESEEDFGFPSKIELSGAGETVVLKGTNSLPVAVSGLDLLDYDGDGGSMNTDDGCITATTDWLTVRYSTPEYKLSLVAEPNGTGKKRKLYLYLYSGNGRQEITVVQSK